MAQMGSILLLIGWLWHHSFGSPAANMMKSTEIEQIYAVQVLKSICLEKCSCAQCEVKWFVSMGKKIHICCDRVRPVLRRFSSHTWFIELNEGWNWKNKQKNLLIHAEPSKLHSTSSILFEFNPISSELATFRNKINKIRTKSKRKPFRWGSKNFGIRWIRDTN